jgi:ABC-type glycerol-3-phosphate transport system permease component
MATLDITTLDLEAIARKERPAESRRLVLFAVALLLAVAWLAPFYYLVISVFKTNAEYGSGHPLALPQSWEPLAGNVLEAWSKTRMGEGMFNSAW